MYVPTTTAPVAHDLLSEEGKSRYKALSEDLQRELDYVIADSIIYGVAFDPNVGKPVMSFNSSPDDFLNALGARVEDRIRTWTDPRMDS